MKAEPEIARWLSQMQCNRGSGADPARIHDVQMADYHGDQLTVLKLAAAGITDLRFRNHPDLVSVVIATSGRIRGVAAGRSFTAALNQVSCVLLPDDLLSLTVASDRLAGWLMQLPLGTLHGVCRRQGIPRPDLRLLLDALSGQEPLLIACCEQLLRLSDRPADALRASMAEPLESTLLGLMASVLVAPGLLPQARLQDAHALHVEHALAYMERHMAEMIALRDLCQACYISARTLQVSFQKVRGCTPLQALQELRLVSLRKLLLNRTELKEACTLVGLPPSGRMAANYKRLFGELPSQTRQRAGPGLSRAAGWRAPAAGCDGRCSDNPHLAVVG